MGRKVMAVLGVVAILLGGLWVGQGANVIKGSFMTGDPKWLVIGAIVLLAGVLMIIGSLDRRRRDQCSGGQRR